jgi:hypothetical protein
MTPRMFMALREQWIAERRQQQRDLAVLRMDVINFSICRPKRLVQLEDLLGEPDAAKVAVSSVRPRKLNKRMRMEIANGWRRQMNAMI